MLTLNIAHEVSDAKVSKIKNFLNKEILYNENLNGANFEIQREDLTYIDDEDSNNKDLIILFYKILDIIEK